MDEKEVLAQAAEELGRSGDIEEIKAELTRQQTEAFPLFLFLFTVVKDIFDFPVDTVEMITSATGVGTVVAAIIYYTYVTLFSIPLWLWTFYYMWGKMSRLKRIGLKYGFKGVQSLVKMFEKRIVARFGAAAFAGLLPFLNMLFPQFVLILFAHKRSNKIVAELLAAAEIIGQAATSRDPRAMKRAAGEAIGGAAASIVRHANVSGRLGNRFGEGARQAAGRLEGNVVRAARAHGGRAVAREMIADARANRAPAPAKPAAPQRAGAAGGGNAPRS
jgi:hypothetical protein